MKWLKSFQLVLISASTLAGLSAQTLAEWELEIAKEGIEVYTSPGNGAVKTFLGKATYKHSVSDILTALLDNAEKTRWVPDLQSIEVFDNNEEEQLLRMVIDMPWPISDRDIIVAQWVSSDIDTVWVHFQSRPEEIPSGNLPRITYSEGYYKLFPTEEKKTVVHYLASTDPGLNLPVWLINMKISETPLKTLKNLKHHLSK